MAPGAAPVDSNENQLRRMRPHILQVGTSKPEFSKAAKFRTCIFNRFKFLDVGIYGVLFKVHVLSQFQDLRGDCFGYDHYAVGVCDNDAAWFTGTPSQVTGTFAPTNR